MADEQKNEQQKSSNEEKSKGQSPGIKKFLPIIIMVVVVLIAAAGGIVLAQMLVGPRIEPEPVAEDPRPKNFEEFLEKMPAEQPWTFELSPVVANLDEPGVTRYVRSTIVIELNAEMEQAMGELFLEQKKTLLTDWLNTYLAGLSLERVRGTNNLSRIKQEIRDNFNELLFPDSKPYVKRILLKEFAVQ